MIAVCTLLIETLKGTSLLLCLCGWLILVQTILLLASINLSTVHKSWHPEKSNRLPKTLQEDQPEIKARKHEVENGAET